MFIPSTVLYGKVCLPTVVYILSDAQYEYGLLLLWRLTSNIAYCSLPIFRLWRYSTLHILRTSRCCQQRSFSDLETRASRPGARSFNT